MGRRESRPSRRENSHNSPSARKGSGLFTGLLIGLAIGIALAAALVWYLNMVQSPLKADAKHEDTLASDAAGEPANERQAEPAKAEIKPQLGQPEPTPPTPIAPTPKAKEIKPQPAPRTASSPPPRPKVNYTFYGILPGDKPARPVEPPPSKDTWWLQIAALSDQNKAEQIRAKLVLLNLRASTQKIESNGQPLYRIRVGPYKREDDAFGDLDTLTENNFYARLLKDTGNSP